MNQAISYLRDKVQNLKNSLPDANESDVLIIERTIQDFETSIESLETRQALKESCMILRKQNLNKEYRISSLIKEVKKKHRQLKEVKEYVFKKLIHENWGYPENSPEGKDLIGCAVLEFSKPNPHPVHVKLTDKSRGLVSAVFIHSSEMPSVVSFKERLSQFQLTPVKTKKTMQSADMKRYHGKSKW